MILPLLKINFWQSAVQQNQAIRVLQVVSYGDEYMNNIVVTAQKSSWSWEQLYPFVYLLVSFIFLFAVIRTLYLIYTLLKKYPVQQIEAINFVNTDDDSTPFSFMKYIFWNSSIDINTTAGRQIFKHEVAHIQEKHSYDKLFVNITLVFFWCNPFFWLYRKELNMIHEFIADKKAVEDSDTSAFAAMILQAAYPKHRFELTNNFFYSPIKRRLMMLSKNKNPKANYIGRIMVLPLIVLVFAAFSLKAKNDGAKAGTQFKIVSNAKDKSSTLPLIDSLFKSVALKKITDTVPKKISENATTGKKLLYILNGQEIDEQTLLAISPSDIEIVNVFKDKDAIVKYGEKAKDGVVEVFLKKHPVAVSEATNPALMSDSMITMYGFRFTGGVGWKIKNIPIPINALLIVNGKTQPEEIVCKIQNIDISDINVLSPDEGILMYGEKGKNGVAVINTKSGYEVQTWLLDTLIIYRTDRPLVDFNKKILIVFDGKLYANRTLQEVVNETGIGQFETMLFLSKEKGFTKYGDIGKDGAIIITSKKVKEGTIDANTVNDLKPVNQEPKIYLGTN
jgi:hypothetical protein